MPRSLIQNFTLFKSDARLKNTTSVHESVVGDDSKGVSAYASPNPSFCPKWEVDVKVGLREGWEDNRTLHLLLLSSQRTQKRRKFDSESIIPPT